MTTAHNLGARPDQLLDIGEVAARLTVSKSLVRTLMDTGALPPVRLGVNVLRFRESDVEALVSGQRQVICRPQHKWHKPTGRPRGRPRKSHIPSAEECLGL